MQFWIKMCLKWSILQKYLQGNCFLSKFNHFTDGESETRSCDLSCQRFTQVVKEVKLESGSLPRWPMCSPTLLLFICLKTLMEAVKSQAFTVLAGPIVIDKLVDLCLPKFFFPFPVPLLCRKATLESVKNACPYSGILLEMWNPERIGCLCSREKNLSSTVPDLCSLLGVCACPHSPEASILPLWHTVSKPGDVLNGTAVSPPIQWQIWTNNINSLAIPWHLFQCKCIFSPSIKPNSNLSRDKSFFLGSEVCKIPIFKALNLPILTGVRKH